VILKQKDYYKKYCTILKKVIKEAKKLYYNTLIKTSANKIKTTWNIIRENNGKIQDLNGISEINLENEIVEDSREIAYAFNKYFLSRVENLSLNDSNQSMAVTLLKKSWLHKITKMKSIPVTEGEIVNKIRSLKHKNSTGYDNIFRKVIKYCAMEISKPLNYICNYSLQVGICPERFKCSVVRPIYKKGDKTRMTNYRPISLLIIF
jgi:hypothetical protein